MTELVSESARKLAALGASKGGRSRAAALPHEERQRLAREAALARWGDTLARPTHTGSIDIGGTVIECAVLENRTRLLTQESFLVALGRDPKPKAGTGSAAFLSGVAPFLTAENVRPYISDELRRAATPISFRTDKGVRAYGYDAMILPMVCEVFLDLAEAKRVNKSGRTWPVLHATQKHIVARCKVLIRGFARVGIIALVDEATGFQEDRARDELRRILEAYVDPVFQKWVQKFPNEFFREVYRLHGWAYRPGTAKRTPYVGKVINRYIYEQLPEPVLPELQRLNPVQPGGYRKRKHHQYLTEHTGIPHLDKQITTVLTLMQISRDWSDLDGHFQKLFPKDGPIQQRLPLVIDLEDEMPRQRSMRNAPKRTGAQLALMPTPA